MNTNNYKFTNEKYKALAYGSPQGKMLSMLVEDYWNAWLDIVAEAPWLRNWVRSSRYSFKRASVSPGGRRVNIYDHPHANIALDIYVAAVWGYGIEDWDLHAPVREGSFNAAMREMLRLQEVCVPSSSRIFVWDPDIYKGCKALVPYEIGTLDKWLAPFWEEACSPLPNSFII